MGLTESKAFLDQGKRLTKNNAYPYSSVKFRQYQGSHDLRSVPYVSHTVRNVLTYFRQLSPAFCNTVAFQIFY